MFYNANLFSLFSFKFDLKYVFIHFSVVKDISFIYVIIDKIIKMLNSTWYLDKTPSDAHTKLSVAVNGQRVFMST